MTKILGMDDYIAEHFPGGREGWAAAEARLAEMNRRRLAAQAASDKGEHLIETRERSGVRYGIAASRYGGCGYARLPEALRGRWMDFHDVPLEAHWGLTYGPDGGGWVGFDTAHAGDCWDADELYGLLDAEQREYADAVRASGLWPLRLGSEAPNWTVARLWDATEQLADRVIELAKLGGQTRHVYLPTGASGE